MLVKLPTDTVAAGIGCVVVGKASHLKRSEADRNNGPR